MNILILSVGTRNKIVQYFHKELKGQGKIFTTDCSSLAPALYDSDRHFIVPRINDPNYIDVLLELCKTHKIDAVFSLIDPELSLLAKHQERFKEVGTRAIISEENLVNLTFDKFAFYQYAKQRGFNVVPTYNSFESFQADYDQSLVDYPLFVKPIRGSASININKVNNSEELTILLQKYDDLIIQKYMDGQEIGVDVYVDMISGELVSLFAKNKLLMRSGETDKSVSMKDDKLFDILKKFVGHQGFKGMLDFDIFLIDGDYYISEINPRFGGGYLHAYEAGVNFPRLIFNNLQGEVNTVDIGNYKEGSYMMKYNEVKFLETLEN